MQRLNNLINNQKIGMDLNEAEQVLDFFATDAGETGLWVLDADTGRIRVTPLIRQLLEFIPDEEMNIRSLLSMIHPDDRGRVRVVLSRSMETQDLLKIEFRICRPDGSACWIMARGRSYRLNGLPLRIMGVAVDISERKQVELQLKRSETSLITLINSTPDLIWSVDAKRFGLITFNMGLNEYFLNEVGLRIKPGMTPHDLFDSEEHARIWDSFYRRLLNDGPFSTEYETYRGNRALKLNFNTLECDGALFGISVFAQDITSYKALESQLREQLEEIKTLKTQKEEENIYLREEVKTGLGFGRIIGTSDSLQYVLFRAQQVAPTDATVLILGETGVGKGMVAHAVHGISRRKDKMMVTVNCAALPANLVESELFGREKGAFTGAHARQAGRFEIADGGTIFLDEIGELPLELQAKLLRVLQDGEFERLGSPRTVEVDVRVIASTSRNLKDEVRNGRFREDLYYRLNTFPVTIPPLRKRIEDIPELAMHFIDKYARKFGRRYEKITRDVMQRLQAYDWPGNVRELEHIIERAAITSPGPVFRIIDQLDNEPLREGEVSIKGFEAMAREHILQALQKTSWKIEGESGAATLLGINPSTLRFRIKKLGISRPV